MDFAFRFKVGVKRSLGQAGPSLRYAWSFNLETEKVTKRHVQDVPHVNPETEKSSKTACPRYASCQPSARKKFQNGMSMTCLMSILKQKKFQNGMSMTCLTSTLTSECDNLTTGQPDNPDKQMFCLGFRQTLSGVR